MNKMSSWQKAVGKKHIPVMCQIEQGTTIKIWWILNGYTPAGTTRNYEIYSKKELAKGGRFEIVQDSSVFRIFNLGKEVLGFVQLNSGIRIIAMWRHQREKDGKLQMQLKLYGVILADKCQMVADREFCL